MRILHVLGSLDRGGVETWMVHVLRTIDRSLYSVHFALHNSARSALEPDIEALGARVHRLPTPSPTTWMAYKNEFSKLVDECGPSIVHSHVHFFSGRVLQLAQRLGIPGRIAHAHTDLTITKQGLYRTGYAHTMRKLIQRHATGGLASSPEAAADLFGPEWSNDFRWSVLPCGIDLTPYQLRAGSMSGTSKSLRKDLGISESASVIGHVGRFVAVKNHRFIVEIAQEVLKKAPDTIFLLVGWGPLQGQVEADIRERGLQDRCRVIGERRDVPELMMQVFDVLVLPSLLEGGSITMFEAQAAGVHCVVSDRVPRTAQIVPGLVRTLSLSEPSSAWADVLLATVSESRRSERSAPLAVMKQSPANIRVCVERLQQVYERSVLAPVPQP
jgi:glycosyltransferase involved in cell wall biosynthesis